MGLAIGLAFGFGFAVVTAQGGAVGAGVAAAMGDGAVINTMLEMSSPESGGRSRRVVAVTILKPGTFCLAAGSGGAAESRASGAAPGDAETSPLGTTDTLGSADAAPITVPTVPMKTSAAAKARAKTR